MPKNKRTKVLLIEDDELFRESIIDYLDEEYEVLAADSAEEALRLLKEQSPELALLDINLPGMDGMEFLKKVKPLESNLPVIMLTASESIPKVVESVKLGAYDYLTKPLDTDKLFFTISRALEASDTRQELEQRRNLQLITNKEYELIGESASMKKLKKEIEVVGRTDSTVLVQGESGTGKELVARAIHTASPRASGPFVAINCGAIPKDLMESELFGHKKGAFTGAQQEAIGKFRLANKGTLLLDEVSEMSEEAQIKLLRVLEEQEFYQVGGTELIKVDVRIVASTNKNLKERVEKGRFREDLFFRLNIYVINIAPLRERPDDIISIAQHYMEHYNIKFNKNFEQISPEAKQILLQHSWKGNARELRNLMERVLLFNDGSVIKKEHLDFMQVPSPQKDKAETDEFRLPDSGLSLEELEKKLILQALERAKWNKTKAAKLLNLSPPTFYYRMEKYGLKE